MVLIDLTTGESADLTQGFGPFDFVPSDEHCFDERIDDDTKHLQRVYPSGITKLDNGGVLQEGSAASGMRPISLLDLPPTDRTRIYQSLVDELRGRPEGDHPLDTQLFSTVPGIRFIIADKTFDMALPNVNDPFVAVVAQPPTERNIDHRVDPGDPPQRLDVLETFKALRSGEIDRLDPNLPPCWKTKSCGFRVPDDPMDVTPDGDQSDASSEESEAELSDDHSDDSGWDSDNAEVIVNLRRAQQHPDGWQPDALLSARLEESNDVSMVDDDRLRPVAPLRIMIDPRAALDSKCPVHNPPATARPHHMRRVCTCFTRHPSVYDDVRALAQSHPTVAAELGALLWRDAVVEVEEPAALLRFAQERPAAMPLVRGLVLTLDCAGTDMDTKTEDLEAVVEIVERRELRLRVIVVKLHTTVTAGEESAVGMRLREWGGLVRRLSTEGFALMVSDFYHVGEKVKAVEENERLREVMRTRLLREWTPMVVEGGAFDLPLRTRGL
ncbi:hypothetical protein B0T18DRAFT_432781 [Schizothecium vesticola]|uniref:Uncharacterized protein n=1 Tax=Schizothecium vesticola TaxID=314040 RepID=A0AA40BPB2_9PEZI|nr:hypothetical protein B0T18DRAFT_432781 [Schizothecium vesticola]